jgi:hypothetical protein
MFMEKKKILRHASDGRQRHFFHNGSMQTYDTMIKGTFEKGTVGQINK